jgi:hypothetical protein
MQPKATPKPSESAGSLKRKTLKLSKRYARLIITTNRRGIYQYLSSKLELQSMFQEDQNKRDDPKIGQHERSSGNE